MLTNKRRDMKKILTLALVLVVALMATSCGPKGKENPLVKGVVGEWKLTSWSASLIEQIEVYVEFKADNTFVLYQKDLQTPINYVTFKGTYLISGDIITGKYSDGKNWGATNGYQTTLEPDGTLKMVNADNPDDVSKYTKTTIPSSVKGGAAKLSTRGDEAVEVKRYL